MRRMTTLTVKLYSFELLKDHPNILAIARIYLYDVEYSGDDLILGHTLKPYSGLTI
jgi:hypothetical protein